jgi:hypothetical protein
MNFEISTINDKIIWDDFVSKSKQGSIFSMSNYLDSIQKSYKLFIVKNNENKILAGFVLLEDSSKMNKIPYPFTPFNGILFCNDFENMIENKKNNLQFNITTYIINELTTIYNNFEMSLSPNFHDLRPFIWYNYGGSPTFNIKIRYTSILNLEDFDLTNYLTKIRTVRRQEFNKCKAIFDISFDINTFLDLYLKTFERQDIKVNDLDLKLIRNITEAALRNNYGILSKASIDEKIVSMNLFIYDNNTAYYLFGVNDPVSRNSGASTFLMINTLNKIKKMNLKFVDFVGINSPKRGDFKLSFNPTITQYHEVFLN